MWDADLLTNIQALYDQGLFVQALATGTPLGPLHTWPGPDARILAGRLASQLSAERVSAAIFLRLWRAHPSSAEAAYFLAPTLMARRGPLAALELFEHSTLIEAESSVRWDATAFMAYLYAQYRDFERAERLMDTALKHSDTSWMWTERAVIYELEDRYEEALDAARRAYALTPHLPAAVLCLAHVLTLVGLDEDSIETLRRALMTIESPRIAASLTELHIERGHYTSALDTLNRFEQLAVVKDKGTVAWLSGRRSDVYQLLGDRRAALTYAHLAKVPFYEEVANNLDRAESAMRRVLLPVGFVRQHHMTCAPATLAAISRYWKKPADHLTVAEAICYDGTPHHSERHWAVTNGWVAREFTVTWDSACALIDAGIPFTLTTPYPGGSHLQAVIGYDAPRGVLLIRDPYERVSREFAQMSFFRTHAATGPRGMALVPYEERERLDLLLLPEADLHDLQHQVQQALSRHDRAVAVASCEELLRRAPEHRITLNVQRSLANYDGQPEEELELIERLLKLAPTEINLRLYKSELLRRVADRSTYLAYLEAQTTGSSPHALFTLRYAQALLDDGRTRAEATRLVEALLRKWNSAEGLSTLADAHWYSGGYPKAVNLYRLAATMESTYEGHATTYFRASRTVREEETALTFLRDRVSRYGTLSPQPAITLFHCLSDLHRTQEAMGVRDQALDAHPEDGALLLMAARSALDTGDSAQAGSFLQRARACCRQTEWVHTAAQIQEHQGDLAGARSLWKELVTSEPFDLKAQRALVRLTADLEGRATAISYLRAVVSWFPHHQGLNELLAEWLDEAPLSEQEAALCQLLTISPTNAWGRRQLAMTLAQQGRFDEARAESQQAYELAPDVVPWYSTRGYIELLAGQLVDAQAHFRAALRRSIDSDYALTKLIEACSTRDERRDALRFVVEEFTRQVIVGDSLLTFQQAARGTFEPDELTEMLEDARRVRPDLWQTWVACIRQHLDRQQYDSAHDLCLQAIAKFPLLPRVHVELAEVAKRMGDRLAERTALHEALRLNPAWGAATTKLAESFEADGDFNASRACLERAIRHAPTEGVLHGYLGSTLWRLEAREEAITHIQQAVRLYIGYDWAWDRLGDYCATVERPHVPLELARGLAAERPGEPLAWMAVARVTEDVEEKLAALERAIHLAPFTLAAHLVKVETLIAEQRYEDALMALRTTAWGARPPVALRIKEPSVLAARGDKEAALATLQDILCEEPDYAPGWEVLADWQAEREDYPAYLEAARALHRLDPDSPYALGYLAHALLNAEPETDVRPYLRRALQLKSDYVYGAQLLFDLELQAKAYEAADAVLTTLRTHVNSAETRLRGLRLALACGQREEIFQVFENLWSTEDDIEIYREALELLDSAGWRHETTAALERLVLEPTVNPVVGTLWVERRDLMLLTLQRFRGFDRVLHNGAAGQLAAQAMLQRFADSDASSAVQRLLRHHGSTLARDETTHGLMAYALIMTNASRDVVQWFGDWRQRSGSPAWAFLNLACAFRDMGQYEDAHNVSRHALSLKEDHTFPEHRTWLAYDAARDGDYGQAQALLALIEGKSVSRYYQFVIAAARFHLVAGTQTGNGHRRELKSAYREVRRAWRWRYISLKALLQIRWHACKTYQRVRFR